ncbi:MAG: Rrf2 family transcriptional regulator [Alphaproteobacteria bacterium GM202ARS2]|nr:Rrf2 family transcriptional regulator [Alphaproteobacteria bacterium GM202ARS2]
MTIDGGNKRLFYGVLAVVDIAYHGGGTPVRINDIADRQTIGKRYLEDILAQLTRAGVLNSERGPRGGYVLARERRRITLADIADGIDKSNERPHDKKTETRFNLTKKVVMPLWQHMEEQLLDVMKDITIEDVCLRARQQGIAQKSLEGLDWSI